MIHSVMTYRVTLLNAHGRKVFTSPYLGWLAVQERAQKLKRAFPLCSVEIYDRRASECVVYS